MSEIQTNGQDGTAAAVAPSLTINAQYLRDLSFENPRAPESLMTQGGVPEVKIDVDVKARQLNQDVFESVVALKVEAKQDGQVAFVVDVEYGAVVTIKNATQDLIAALLLIEAPRIVFPFVRSVVADATRDGGFPPLMINPIDFAEVQRRKAAQAQQAPAAANA
jgi:preprotein translocase subunit SecB